MPYITRIETLHFIAGTKSIRNLFRQHCAQFLHTVLLCQGGDVRRRIIRELCAQLRTPTLELQVVILPVDLEASFVADSSGVPTSVLENTRWMTNEYLRVPRWETINTIYSSYVTNSAEMRRTTRGRKETYMFEETHSWIDVGLQVLSQIGWRPECSQPQVTNVPKALPPNCLEAHFFPGQYPPRPREDEHTKRCAAGSKRDREETKIEILCGAIRVDEIFATVAMVIEEGVVRFCSGFVHGVGITKDTPEYVHEATALHALRVLKEWLTVRGQAMCEEVHIRSGPPGITYKIREWVRTGRCSLISSAAAGIVEDIQTMQEWLKIDTYFNPFYLPDEVGREDDYNIKDPKAELFLRLAEHFRSVVIPQQGEKWRLNLPRIPVSTAEVKEKLQSKEEEDERIALRIMKDKGSTSAAILTYLDLTREIIQEAFKLLRGARRAQVNLAEILGATRFKILTKGKVYHVKCPRTYCYVKDSFEHMLECHSLQEEVRTGVEAVPFLVKMAKITVIPPNTKRIPYMVEYQTG